MPQYVATGSTFALQSPKWSGRVTPADIHHALKHAAKSVPRYLFRAWSAKSGGNKALNSPQAITPLYFLHHPANWPRNIFDINGLRLRASIEHHLSNYVLEVTPFSTWTHSLPVVLRSASLKRKEENTHISVIDTERLAEQNFTFYCGMPHLMEVGIPVDDELFLVFGVISGDVHTAVSFEQIEAHIVGSPDPPTADADRSGWDLVQVFKDRMDQEIRPLDLAPGFGKLFGREFQLPMAIYLLSVRQDAGLTEKVLKRLIKKLGLPAAWSDGPEFRYVKKTSDEVVGQDDEFPETTSAITSFRNIVATTPALSKAKGKGTSSSNASNDGTVPRAVSKGALTCWDEGLSDQELDMVADSEPTQDELDRIAELFS